MKKYNLGVNGALIKSIEHSLEYAEQLRCEAEYVLYDTPRQMELFIYFESGRKTVEVLKENFSATIFLMDMSIVRDPGSFISTILQN